MYYIKDFNELNPGPQTGSLTSMYEGGINYERYENIKIPYKCFSLLYIIIFLKLLLDIHFSTSASCCHVLYRSICELLTLDQVFLFGFLQVKNDQGCVIRGQIVKTQLFLKSQPTIVLSILELAHLNLLIIKARGKHSKLPVIIQLNPALNLSLWFYATLKLLKQVNASRELT